MQQTTTSAGELFQFYFTFPQGERLCMSSTEKCCSKFQSTFPQGERQVLASAYANVVDISIHVPTRGTTVITISEILIPNEFQSTFPQGERRFATSGPYSFGAFQSTFPQGERQTMVLHAGKVPYFNPRSHKGNDLKVKTSTRSQEFQSTFPQGERQQKCTFSLHIFATIIAQYP